MANVIRVQDPQTLKYATHTGWSRRLDEARCFASIGDAEAFCRSQEMLVATAVIDGHGPHAITIGLVLNRASRRAFSRRKLALQVAGR